MGRQPPRVFQETIGCTSSPAKPDNRQTQIPVLIDPAGVLDKGFRQHQPRLPSRRVPVDAPVETSVPQSRAGICQTLVGVSRRWLPATLGPIQVFRRCLVVYHFCQTTLRATEQSSGRGEQPCLAHSVGLFGRRITERFQGGRIGGCQRLL